MSEPIAEYIQLNDHYRLAVHYEDAPECPRGDWAMITGFAKINGRGDRNLLDVPAVHEEPIGIIGVHHHFIWKALGQAEPIVERWARIFHGMVVEWDAEHGGYWFCDPTEFEANFHAVGDGKVKRIRQVEGAPINTYENYEQDSLEVQAEVIASERETYRQWADGEVYGVVLEKRVDLYELDDNGIATNRPAVEIWEEPEGVDSAIWGCYLDDKYTAFVVAKEHFDLPPDTESSASCQHYIDTGEYLVIGEVEHGKK